LTFSSLEPITLRVVAQAAPLRPLIPARFRRRSRARTVEALLEEIRRLVGERQVLRERTCSAAALEQNRRKIARAQWELSHALIDRHQTAPAEQDAA
jgi:hypothetical protein